MESIKIRDNIRWVKCHDGKVVICNLRNNQILELERGFSSFLWEAIAEIGTVNGVADSIHQVYCSEDVSSEELLSDIQRALRMLQNLELIDLEMID